jgi:hypothetical protein
VPSSFLSMTNNRKKEEEEEEEEEERRIWKARRINDKSADVSSNGYFDVFICCIDASHLIPLSQPILEMHDETNRTKMRRKEKSKKNIIFPIYLVVHTSMLIEKQGLNWFV